jgi:hypothetical protein
MWITLPKGGFKVACTERVSQTPRDPVFQERATAPTSIESRLLALFPIVCWVLVAIARVLGVLTLLDIWRDGKRFSIVYSPGGGQAKRVILRSLPTMQDP